MKRISDILMVLFVALFVSAFGIFIFAKPQTEFSENENRVLTKLPDITPKNISNGEFSKNLGDFFCDQFPARNIFTKLKCKIELSLGRAENNGVIFGKEGYLVIRPSYDDLYLYQKNLSSVNSFLDKCSDDIPTAVFFAPRGIDVLDTYLPSYYPYKNDNQIWEIAHYELSNLIDVRSNISDRCKRGDKIWFKTDHHWTSLGAYEGYKKIIAFFGDTPIPSDCFTVETVSTEFHGTTVSRSGNTSASTDKIFLLRYNGDRDFAVINYDTNEITQGFYQFDALSKKDKYSVFLGGNTGHMGIYGTDGAKKETIMIIKDSFANSLVPFLASNYNVEMYDLRYFKGSINEEVSRISPDKILILYGIDTAVTDPSLGLLGR